MIRMMNQLKLMRSRKGMTQEEVAEQVGVSRQAVAKWEKGDTLPDVESCVKLADLYGVPLDMLIRGLKEDETMPDGQKMFGCVKMNDKGQITLPVQVRELFGLKPGNMILVLADTDRGIALVNLGDMNNDMMTGTMTPQEGVNHERD